MVRSALTARVERIEDAADLAVHEADAREIRTHERAPLLGFEQPGEPRFRELPVEIPGEFGHVVAIVGFPRGHHQRFVGVEVEPTLGREARTCGNRNPTATKKGCPDGGDCNRAIAASAIFQSAWSSSFSGKTPQSIALIGSGVVTNFRGGYGIAPATDQACISRAVAWRHRPVVKQLPRAEGRVALSRQGLGQRDMILERLDRPESRLQRIDPRRRRRSPVKRLERDAVTEGRLAMGVREQGPRRANRSMFGVFTCG